MVKFKLTLLMVLFSGASLLAQPDFLADTLEGCDELTVSFRIDTNTVDTDTISAVQWQFGNGNRSNTITPDPVRYVVRDSTRSFDITLAFNNDTTNSIRKPGYIVVHKSYNARFIVQELNDLNASFAAVPQRWTDPTTNYQFQWNISDGTVLSNANETMVHTFSDTGSYTVMLTVEDDFGCIAQYDTSMVVKDRYDFPNILNTRINDYILYVYDHNTPVHFQVFTRSGIKVYESKAPSIYWDGRNLSGNYLNTGIYFYLIESDSDSGTLQHKGFIYILSE